MQSLKESILSSTNTGKASIIDKKIIDWFKLTSEYDLKGNYRVVRENNKNYLVLDDFKHQPYQHYFVLTKFTLSKMPKELNGIFYIYRDRINDEGERRIPAFNFYNEKNNTIDLSNFIYNKPYELERVAINFFNCSNIEIIGLPKYVTEFKCTIEYGKNITVKNIKDDNCVLWLDSTNSYNFENCNLKKLYFQPVSKTNHTHIFDDNISDYEKGIIYFTDDSNKIIDKILKNNKIKNLVYFGAIPTGMLTTTPIKNIKDKYYIQI